MSKYKRFWAWVNSERVYRRFKGSLIVLCLISFGLVVVLNQLWAWIPLVVFASISGLLADLIWSDATINRADGSRFRLLWRGIVIGIAWFLAVLITLVIFLVKGH
ncbi:hypothetical protein GPK34_04530 [Secundilactobacillus kimchicus]|uniref:hypothetical protein n=1 Tax=Secundilactobacillus kimchicus TaxID=528209 RepID=UPI001C038B01|nr:hypothetical protein [Secundilactobacillus kimchicus]MBT9671299.1 hypothetical protein [Secundilactobacillus kimchicus]